MLTKLNSFANIGIECEKITVEIACSRGDMPSMHIVGLGDKAVQESAQRVKMALRSSGLNMPTGRAITINLAPADLRKAGPRYDLPIALGLMLLHGAVLIADEDLESTAFIGELALDGTLRHVSGVLPAAIACKDHGIKTLVVPSANAPEARLIPGIKVIFADSLIELAQIFNGERACGEPLCANINPLPENEIDFADVRGQEHAKRALEIAAAGGHNVLLSGAPGAGKTLLARAFKGILPPLSQEESIEVMKIYSVANLLPRDTALIQERPFRIIHHTASGVSIVGGGQIPGPGEISLAHKGVLFLDELGEFPSQVLEVLRQPLEDRTITITRAHGAVTFPADFIMVAAMNPPRFSSGGVQKFKSRISKPFLDRIDLTIDVLPVPVDDLQKEPNLQREKSNDIRNRVIRARERQSKRFTGLKIRTNKEMNVKHIDLFCKLDTQSSQLLRQAVTHLDLSARSYHRVIKVSRTIADLAGENDIMTRHIAEALQYRQNIGV